ncbi:MAG TPA: hypothetical protein VFI25_11000 [Planctomycetota bacterium]|jgi:hypothetical protein|nr:hypothetical protein [Planctomycetota bacterium]
MRRASFLWMVRVAAALVPLAAPALGCAAPLSAPPLSPTVLPEVRSAGGDDDLARLVEQADAMREAIEGMRRASGSVRLAVNGEEIPPAAVERALVYIFGRAYIERKIRDFLVADEIEYRRKKGEVVEDLRVGASEVANEVDSMNKQLVDQIQGGFDPRAVKRLQGFDDAAFADEQASQLLFDKVFIPEDPSKWPDTTTQALASQGGADFVEKTKKGLIEHREKNPGEPMPPFYRTIFRQWITKALKESSKIRTASDGLPADVVLTVNDRPLPTADAYPAVARLATAIDRERVLRWIAWTSATRQALVRAGAYLSEEDFAKEWQAHVGPYEKSPLNMEVVATNFKKFPSYDLYREHFRLRKSFERMIGKEITEEALGQHRTRVQDFLGEGKVDAQVILCTALDYTDFTWKGPDAFDRARSRAEEVVARLKEGTPFEDLIDRYSEFFDPPAPPAGQQAPAAPRPNRGRFGPQSKNQLKQLLGESEFDEIVRGYSIAEILFHDAPVGEAVGPIRGPLGYYVGRVLGRLPGGRPVDLAQPSQHDLVRDDFVARRFLDWSNDVVAKSKIEIR